MCKGAIGTVAEIEGENLLKFTLNIGKSRIHVDDTRFTKEMHTRDIIGISRVARNDKIGNGPSSLSLPGAHQGDVAILRARKVEIASRSLSILG